MRGMPRVRMFSTWVSPRWNKLDPWAVASSPTSADRARSSAGPRPSMRTPSLTMRWRMSFLTRARTAALTSRSRPSNSSPSSATTAWVASSVAALRSALVAMVCAWARRSPPTEDTRS